MTSISAVAVSTSSGVVMTTSTMATISTSAMFTNMVTSTPGGGGGVMDGSSCKIYQSMLLVLTLAVLSVTAHVV